MEENAFDLLVIGAGPGGYECAIRAAQLGLKTAVADDWVRPDGKAAPGGTCTNAGCIPSKALLASSAAYEDAREFFPALGVSAKEVSFDLGAIQARKSAVVSQNNDGILFLFRKNHVTFFSGRASFVQGGEPGAWKLEVKGSDNAAVTAKNVVIAAGSLPRKLGGGFDEDRILSSTGALSLSEVPARLGIIGAGVVGLELGTVWRRLGSKVTVIEALPGFLGMADADLAAEGLRQMKKQGMAFHFGAMVKSVKHAGSEVEVVYEENGKAVTEVFDRLIVSIGRVPNAASVNPSAAGLALTERGFVEVDGECRTNLEGVWAIGDCVRGPMLAHKASAEGVAVAERIAGEKPPVDLSLVPSVIYTDPEMAWVGQTEKQARESGATVKCGKFPFMANGRARASGKTSGFVKVVADAETDRILGIHAIGPEAGELAAAASVLLSTQATCEDAALTMFAHPTLSEAVKEACLAARGQAINI